MGRGVSGMKFPVQYYKSWTPDYISLVSGDALVSTARAVPVRNAMSRRRRRGESRGGNSELSGMSFSWLAQYIMNNNNK